MERYFVFFLIIAGISFYGCVSSTHKDVNFEDNSVLSEFDKWIIDLAELKSAKIELGEFANNDCDMGIDESLCSEIGVKALKINVKYAVRYFAKGCYYGDTKSCLHLAVLDRNGEISNDSDGKYYDSLKDHVCPVPESQGCADL